MSHLSKKLTVGLSFAAAVALLGMKDTGVFLKAYTPDNHQVSYRAEQRVDITKEDSQCFYIEGGEIAVPKSVLIKTEEKGKGLEAKSPTRLYQAINGPVERFIFTDEYVEIISREGNWIKVKCFDGKEGYVKAADMMEAVAVHRTEAVAKVDKFLMNRDLLYTLTPGKKVHVVNFNAGQFDIVDDQGNLFRADAADISIVAPAAPVNAPAKTPERIAAATVNPDTVRQEKPSVKAVVDQDAPPTTTKEKPAPAPVPTSAGAKEKIDFALSYSKAQLERPYVYADTGKAGYDCSGLIYDIFNNQLGIKINRSSYDQIENGIEVLREELIPGDIIFFNTTSQANSHVGMYIGDGKFIHASSGSGKVVITDLDMDYYSQRYSTARRLIND